MADLSPHYGAMGSPLPLHPSDHAATLKRLLSRQASWQERLSRTSSTQMEDVNSPCSSSACSPETTPASTPRLKAFRLSDVPMGMPGARSGGGRGWQQSGGNFDEGYLRRPTLGGGPADTSVTTSTNSSAYTSPDITRPSSRISTPTEESLSFPSSPNAGPSTASTRDHAASSSSPSSKSPLTPLASHLASPSHPYIIHDRNSNYVPVFQLRPISSVLDDRDYPVHDTDEQNCHLGKAPQDYRPIPPNPEHKSPRTAPHSSDSVPESTGKNKARSLAPAIDSDGASNTGNASSGPTAYANLTASSTDNGGSHAPWGEMGEYSGDGDELGEDGEDEHGGDGKKGKNGGAMKKKAAKACLQCQKAHLTCDDARPCTRCVSKGIGDSCEEGRRKKAKYLMTEEEKALAVPRKRVSARNANPSSERTRQVSEEGESTQTSPPLEYVPSPPQPTFSAIPPLTAVDQGPSVFDPSLYDQMQVGSVPALLPQSQPFLSQPMLASNSTHGMGYFGDSVPGNDDFLQDSDPIFNLNFDPNYQFGSQAANLEYTMLSSMFADTAMTTPTNGYDNSLFQLDGSWPATDEQRLDQGGPDLMTGVRQDMTGPDGFDGPSFSLASVQAADGMGLSANGQDPILAQSQYNPHHPFGSTSRLQQQDTSMDSPGGSTLTQNTQTSASLRMITPSMVYSQVTRPYDYTEGYHYLMRHLAKHFDQSESLKVVKSLAAFRPSLIALQMPLTIEDEVFLEKSFQRTLIELEKLLSFSGTPTAVWRRTGELCLVSDEFCKLVQMTKLQLLGKKTYVYELFENQSVIDYFERFSQHAFENTTQNFFMRCGLITSLKKQVACSCSFTIRRDVFDLPSAVIGQILPIEP